MSTVNKIVAKPPNRQLQIRKPLRTTAEQEKALRDQLHIEIENKTKACSNPTFECSIPRVEGYDYCIRHILQDPRSPFKQCTYQYSGTGKKCLHAAPKYDGKKEPGLTTYCFEHSRSVQLDKTRQSLGKYKQFESNEVLLNELTHHITMDKGLNGTKNFADTDEEIDVVSPNVDPFTDFDSLSRNKVKRKRVLDYASDSSSNDDVPTLNNSWKGHECDNSDNESVDSQNEDLLKHAGIYTTEEATMITKQKMTRLQSLYIEQINRLIHLLKEKRRKYLQAIRKERETLCSIHHQPKDTPQERRLYEKLKALNRYQRRNGIEAVLHKKFREKRAKTGDNIAHKNNAFSKCIFTEGGVKCGDRALPCCKYCKKHILEDKKQILFRACSVEKSGVVCQDPVPNIFDDATCVLHINLPTQKSYIQKKFESETEEEDDEIVKKEESIKEIEHGGDGGCIEQQEAATNQIEMFPVDDIGNNVTIVHDQQGTDQSSPRADEEILFEITTVAVAPQY